MATFQHPQITRVTTDATTDGLNEIPYGTKIVINPFSRIDDPDLLRRFNPFIDRQKEAAMCEVFNSHTGQFKPEVIVTKPQVYRTDDKISVQYLTHAGLWNKQNYDSSGNSREENEEQIQKDIIQPSLKNK